MTTIKSVISAVATLGIAASALVLAVPPAAHAQGVGSGRAVIRLDAPSATLTKTGKHSYRMVLPQGTTGQWMGERTNAQGKSQVLVGNITAKKLSNRWGNFRYAQSGAYATLVWGSTPDASTSAVVKLDQPTLTGSGVRFDFTSRASIPKSLTDVTLNIARAAGRHSRSTTQTAVIADALTVSLEVTDTMSQVKARIYNAGNNNTCWGVATINGHQSVAVNTNTCDNIPYTNWYVAGSNGSVTYGVSVNFPDPKRPSTTGSALYNLKVTPSGQSSFQWTHNFTWNQ